MHTHTHTHIQFCDDVVMGRFPASHERLLKLGALRIQFLEGDYKSGATMLVSVTAVNSAKILKKKYQSL